VEEEEVRAWFAEYLSAFAALGRSESRPRDLIAYYGVPSLLTTDEVITWLRTTDDVEAWLQGQADAMSAAGYDHTDTLVSEVAVLNRNTAVHRAQLSRERSDGTQINQMSVTYVLTCESERLRITALVVHSR